MMSTQENFLIVYVTYQLSQLPLYKAVVVKLLHLRIPLSTLDKFGCFLKKQNKKKLPYNPATPLPGIYPKEIKTFTQKPVQLYL